MAGIESRIYRADTVRWAGLAAGECWGVEREWDADWDLGFGSELRDAAVGDVDGWGDGGLWDEHAYGRRNVGPAEWAGG